MTRINVAICGLCNTDIDPVTYAAALSHGVTCPICSGWLLDVSVRIEQREDYTISYPINVDVDYAGAVGIPGVISGDSIPFVGTFEAMPDATFSLVDDKKLLKGLKAKRRIR